MRIREARERQKLHQKDLAAKLKIAQNTLSQYETGKREPDLETLKRIADTLGTSVDYLLERDGTKRESPAQDGELSDRDIRLIKWFRSLPPEKQKAILIAQDGPADTAD